MAIIGYEELPQRTSKLSQDGTRSYERTWRVYSDILDESGLEVELSVGLALGDPYVTSGGSDILAVVTDFNAQQSDPEDPRIWTLTVSYGTEEATEDGEVSWDFSQFESPFDRDANGRAVVNAAGDPFQNALTRDDSRPVLTITRKEDTFNEQLAGFYKDAVNADTFLGKPKGTCKVFNISGRYNSADEKWTVTYQFHFDQGGWSTYVLNQGFRELKNGRLQAIRDIFGVEVQEPVNLDLNGKELEQGKTPVFLKFDKYPRLPFKVFNF